MFAGKSGPNVLKAFSVYRPLDDKMVRRNVELLLILGALFLLDVVTTQIILWMGGVELNPLMTGIVSDPALHLGIKTLFILIIFPAFLMAEQRVRGSAMVFIAFSS